MPPSSHLRPESQIDAVFGIEAIGPQRDPLLRCLSGKVILREIGPIDGRRCLAAHHDEVSLVALATQFLGRREAGSAAPHDDDFGRRFRRRPRGSARLQQLLFVLHEDPVVAPLDFPACQRTECRSVQCFSGLEVETGVMPGTPHGVSDHQPLRKRTAIMGTGGTDREEIVAAPHDKHRFFADMPRQHAAVGKAIDRNPLRKVGTGRIGLRCSHDDLQRTTLGLINSRGVLAATVYIDGGHAK